MEQTGKQVTTGVVLRATDTKEADRILTVLTPDLGKLTLIARGARRRNSPLAASSQVLAYSEWVIYQRAGWYYASQGSTVELFDVLRQDIERLALASYFAELTESVTAEHESAPEILSLLLNGLYALGTLQKEPALVKPVFELRLMALCGFAPLAEGCAVCGAPEPERPVLDTEQGTVRCAACGGGASAVPLTKGALAALRHALNADAARLYAFTADEPSLRSLYYAAEAFTAARMERRFRTLDYYRALRADR
ncbi:MAG: DNA repair protein RecO [Oscillospiraceae bacterium]|nr:DNA repair protein RecO [Oscillospiraceae bacterium]